MDYKNRITPQFINKLKSNEVFVFGSNTLGKHGKGAAKDAMKFGAKYGKGSGMHGQTYAIPMKGENLKSRLELEEIKKHIDIFCEDVKKNPNKTFLVTEVGCGLAGYEPEDIAPMFMKIMYEDNVYLPQNFWKKLKKYYNEG